MYYDFTHKFSAALFPTVMCLLFLLKNLRDSFGNKSYHDSLGFWIPEYTLTIFFILNTT